MLRVVSLKPRWGFFTARLEAEQEAKRQEYTQDLLVSAVVKPPAPIQDQENIQTLQLRMKGFVRCCLRGRSGKNYPTR